MVVQGFAGGNGLVGECGKPGSCLLLYIWLDGKAQGFSILYAFETGSLYSSSSIRT